jgi:catechol 2,3-dioxygenase-like lactoylglutathione lyase family enzyme
MRPVDLVLTVMMQLVQSRIVTDDVGRLARFYAGLLNADVVINDFYMEIPAGGVSVGLSKGRFTEERGCPGRVLKAGETLFDFSVPDVDAEQARLDAMGVEWVLGPTDQPWGTRAMIFRDPDGHAVNVFSRRDGGR